jgi:hypothetical protein
MTDADGTGVPEDEAVVGAAAESEKIPAWAWWVGGAALVVIIMLVWAAIANATPEETEPLPEPTVTASASPSPSPSPSATPSDSPTPMPSPTDVPEPSDSPTPMPSPTDVPEPSDSPTPMPSPTDVPTPPSTFGEGKIVVGTDAAAGTYRVSTAVTEGCLWALKAQGSDRGRDRVSEVIVGGIPTVTLSDGDTFSSKKCGTWNAVDPTKLFKNASAAVSAKPGVWLVGEDIRFGNWSTASLGDTNDPAKVCKWSVTETLANNFTKVVTRGVIFSGTGKVSVAEGQQFESTHCGDWTLLSK